MQFVKPMPFVDAAEKLGGKSVIGSKLLSREWADVPVGLRERAFWSATVENVRFLQRGRDAIGEFLLGTREKVVSPTGKESMALATGSRADFVKQMQAFLEAEGVVRTTGGIKDIASERRLGLIFDTNARAAQDYGAWKQGQDPDVLDAFPAQRFIRVVEVTTARDEHEDEEGQVRLKSDLEFWRSINRDFGVPWGPWGWGCGHDVEDVSRDEAEVLGLLKPGEAVRPVEQEFNEALKASVTNLDPDLQGLLKEQFGDQVMIKDGAAWWKGNRKSKAIAVPPVRKVKGEAAPATVAPPEPVDMGMPRSLADLENVRSLGGSTGAMLVRNRRSGQLFVMKRGASAEHVRSEFAADAIYRAAGAAVPEAVLIEDASGPVKLARFVEGRALSELTEAERAAVAVKLQEHFHVDVLLGNWDVVGLAADNVLVDKSGMPWRIDNGGSLDFRAMGRRKTADEWNPFSTELWSMRDASKAGGVFAKMDFYEVARRIVGADGGRIIEAAPAEQRGMLDARWRTMQDVARKGLEYEAASFVAGHADRITEEMVLLRKAGISELVAPELKQAPGNPVRLVDGKGRPFDNLRTAAEPDRSEVGAADYYYSQILPAVKTVAVHNASGDLAYNKTSLEKMAGEKLALQELAGNGSAEEKKLAKYYLGVIAEVEKAMGKKGAAVPKLEKFPEKTPGGQVKGPKSAIVALAEHMKARGGDWKHVAGWAADQGGSSTSTGSLRLKRWLYDRMEGVKAEEFHTVPAASMAPKDAEYARSFEVFHAFVQEVLGRTEFPGNDQVNRTVRLLRTESAKSAVPFGAGTAGVYKRGVNESGSVYTWFGGAGRHAHTVTVVPHARITSMYFFERLPGVGGDFLLGDGENEFTYMAHRLTTRRVTPNAVTSKPSTNQSEWESK